MAQVLLQDYVEKMREHLSAGRYSDALTLGQHILQHYPKHLETYRLLAEASLESNDLHSAADLFQRVRSADPESIVALVGLSIVYEHRDELDQAIWHLERAFEIQPANSELRQELLRLYQERDGAPRERLKLTPGGLARMYAREGLYPQAVQEFRALLRVDPTRLDLQAALAETLYRAERKQEAAQVAQSLLQPLPFCLKANLLLGKLWSENGVEEGEILLRRAQSLDPENVVARELISDHWDQAAPPTLPPLGGESAALPPSASSSLFDFDQASPDIFENETRASEEEQSEAAQMLERDAIFESLFPTMYAPPRIPESQPVAQPEPESQAATNPETESSAQPESPSPLAEETFEPLFENERGIEESAQDVRAEIPEAERGDLPALFSSSVSEPFTFAKEKSDVSSAEVEASPLPAERDDVSTPARRVLPSLPTIAPSIAGALNKLPDWLRVGAGRTIPAAPIPPFEAPAPAGEPSWLDRLQTATRSEAAAPSDEVAAEVSSEESLEIPDWLRASPAPSAETAPPAPSIAPRTPESGPEWLSRLRDAARSGQVEESAGLETESAEIPGWLSENESPLDDSAVVTEVPPDETNVPDWLRPRAEMIEPETPVAESKAGLPDWLTSKDTGEQQSPASKESASAPSWSNADSAPAPRSAEIETAPSAQTDDAVPDWLRQYSAEAPESTLNETSPTDVMAQTRAEPPSAITELPDVEGTASQSPDSASAGAANASPTIQPERALLEPDELLAQAREFRARGNHRAAIEAYEKVLQRGQQFTPDVIIDLEQFVTEENVPQPAHRLLGDAYAMAGRYKEALEQYRLVLGK